MAKKIIIDLDPVHFIHSTEKAWLLEYDGKEFWVPKSQVEYDREEEVLSIPEWLAIENELV